MTDAAKPFASRLLDKTPWALTAFRAACAPAPWLLLMAGAPAWIAAALIPLALASDVFDGVIARARGVATVLLRRADGWADLAFTLSYAAFALSHHGDALAPHWPGLALLGALQGLAAIQDFARYGRGACYHFVSAKLWALPFYGLLAQLLLGQAPVLIWPMLALGLYASLERLIATRLIPIWLQDQPHLLAALHTYWRRAENGHA